MIWCGNISTSRSCLISGRAPICIECTSTSANVSLFLAWLQPGVQHVYVWGCRGPIRWTALGWKSAALDCKIFFIYREKDKKNKMADFVLSWISSLCCLRPEASLKNIPFKVSFSISIFIQNQPLFNHVWMQRCRKKEKLFIYPLCLGSLRYLAVALLYRLGPVTFFFLNEMNTFILQGCINWSKVTVKTFTLLRKKI